MLRSGEVRSICEVTLSASQIAYSAIWAVEGEASVVRCRPEPTVCRASVRPTYRPFRAIFVTIVGEALCRNAAARQGRGCLLQCSRFCF
jgi:hypothetical protein